MRTGTVAGVTALALALAGCGETKKGFDEGFDKKFHDSFVSSCVSAATRSGAPQAQAQSLCQCTSDKIAAKYSTNQKMGLKNEQIIPLAEECRAEQAR